MRKGNVSKKRSTSRIPSSHGYLTYLYVSYLRAAAIALAEFDEAFNGDGADVAPRGAMSGNRFGGGYPPRGPRNMGPGAGFVRAGGKLAA